MYSRQEENFSMNRSNAQSVNAGLAKDGRKTFDTPNTSSGQKLGLNSNRDQGMNFSIFYGDKSGLRNKPAQFNRDFQERPYQKSNLKQNHWGETFRQNEQVQESTSSINNSVFAKPPPQASTRNSVSFRSTLVRPDDQRQDTNVGEVNNQYSNFAASANTSSSTLELMRAPKSNKPFLISQNSTSSTSATGKMGDASQNTSGSLKLKRYGGTDAEKLCIFTGPVERVIKWGKIFQNHFCYFEVIAGVVSIADGKVQFERIMLLRDKKGPILQVTYYSNSTHINIDDFHLGQMLRAIGRIIGPNIMSAITIRAATNEEIETLPRMCHVSDRAVSTLCGITSL